MVNIQLSSLGWFSRILSKVLFSIISSEHANNDDTLQGHISQLTLWSCIYKCTHIRTKSVVAGLQRTISLTREQCRYCSNWMTVESADQCYQWLVLTSSRFCLPATTLDITENSNRNSWVLVSLPWGSYWRPSPREGSQHWRSFVGPQTSSTQCVTASVHLH